MKGITNVKIYDAETGDITNEVEDDNILTNFFEMYLNKFNDMMNKCFISRHYLNNNLLNTNIRDGYGGIMLFEDILPENPNYVTTSKRATIIAADNNNLQNVNKGSLNTNESGVVEYEGVRSYKFVYDFGTSNGNCTFNTICLGFFELCNDFFVKLLRLQYFGLPINNATHLSHFNSSPINEYTAVIDKNYLSIGIDHVSRNILLRKEIKKSIHINDKFSLFEIVEYPIKGYSNLAYMGPYIDNNILYTLGKDNIDNIYKLIGIDLDTNLVISSEDIGIPITVENITAFGRMEKEYFIINPVFGNSTISGMVIDSNTKTVYNENLSLQCVHNTINRHLSSVRFIFNILNFKNSDGNFNFYHNQMSGSTNVTHYRYCTQYRVYGIDKFHMHYRHDYRWDSDTNLFYQSYMNECTDSICLACNAYRYNILHTVLYPIDNQILLSINNLPTPITKTEANTMKITYILKGSEEVL